MSNEPEWTGVLGIAVNFQAAIGVFAGTVGTAVYQKYSPNTDILLECCRRELEEVRARLNEIPPERREQIQAVVDRGGCKSFQELEETLLGLSDDRCELRERSINTPNWQRHLPATGLRYDIATLRDGIRSLLKDTCNTTNATKRPAQRPSQSQQTPTSGPEHHPSGQPEYSLELGTLRRPSPVHVQEGRERITVPTDLV